MTLLSRPRQATNTATYSVIALAIAVGFLVSCSDEPERRPTLGSPCDAASTCTGGSVCIDSVCLDPVGDDDSDGLLNELEARLGTRYDRADTDGDGEGDFAETNGGQEPSPDFDGDGMIDAIESSVTDTDGDCIPDERDPSGSVANLIEVADWACCCSARCSELPAVVTAVATCDNGQLSCAIEGDQSEAYPCRGVAGDPCESDADCNSGVCHAGRCTGVCGDRDDCGQFEFCDGAVCRPQGEPGAVCSAGNECLSGECEGGVCGGCVASAECDDANDCTNDLCEESRCLHIPRTALCDDGDLCTHDDACDDGGVCVGRAIVCDNDSDTCGVRRACDGSDTCAEMFPASGVACDDGDLCTFNDACDGAGACIGTGITCSGGAAGSCLADTCDGTSTCSQDVRPPGEGCDDGDPCTYDDTCDGAGGCAGIPIVCDDDDGVCGASRSCNGTASCTEVFPTASTACDDGDLCTHSDACDGTGGCAGTAISCADSAGICGANRSCNGTASCTVSFPGGGTACNDSNLCTHSDACNGAGACTGTAISCNDAAGVCGANRSCNGTSSCTVTFPGSSTACSNGNPCSDGATCNGSGVCGPGLPVADGASCGATPNRRCCGGICRSINSDANHCGGCGMACASGQSCQDVAVTTLCDGNTAAVADESPPSTTGRCTCAGATSQCPRNTNLVGSNGQVCRVGQSQYNNICSPVGNAGCPTGALDQNLNQCPDFCYYP